MNSNYKIISSLNKLDISKIKKLLQEYSLLPEAQMCCDGFKEELDNLSNIYGSNNGNIFVIEYNNEYVACVGYTKINKQEIEIKRLYVKPKKRGNGYARLLMECLIADAKENNVSKITLETNNNMQNAISLYESLNFKINNIDNTIHMELDI